MKKVIIICCCLSVHLVANAQDLIIKSTNFFSGKTCYFSPLHASLGNDKTTIVVTGQSNCDKSYNYYNGYLNLFVSKINEQGIVWSKVFGGSGGESGDAVYELKDGSIIVLASTSSADGDIVGYHGTRDFWLIKLDKDGNVIWKRTYGGPYAETATSLMPTEDNGFILLGVCNGVGGDVPVSYSPNEFHREWFVIKTDSMGNIEWKNVYGGSGDELSRARILVGNDGYYLVGSSSSLDHDCTDTAWHSGTQWISQTGVNYDYYVLKLNNTGKVIWSKSFGGSDADVVRDAVWDERDSSIVITGYTSSDDYIVEGYKDFADVLTVKVSNKGDLLWANTTGTFDSELDQTLTKDYKGGGYMAFTNTYVGLGGMDLMIIALSKDGKNTYNKSFGGDNTDNIGAIMPYKNGIMALGATRSATFNEGDLGPKEFQTAGFYSYMHYFPLAVENDKKEVQTPLIYPNPINNTFKIKYPNSPTSKKTNISIYSIDGRKIYNANIPSGTIYTNVNTDKWASGTYYFLWKDDEGTINTQTLMKE